MTREQIGQYVGQWVRVSWTDSDGDPYTGILSVLRVNRDELVSMAGRRIPVHQITAIEAWREPS